MKNLCSISAATLCALAGSAIAQPVIDGQLGPTDNYGAPLFVQNQPTTFGDNVAGVGGTTGNPADVVFGMEFAIPLSALGNPNLAGGIKIGGFVNNGGSNFLSNQVIGGLPANTPNLGNPRNVNFNNIAGNQFITVFPQVVTTAPTIDGQLDGGLGGAYGTRLFTQTNYTGFGDSNAGVVGNSNGNEINGVYAVVDATTLYLFITGNCGDFNKFNVFFDTQPGGQNQLLLGNVGNLANLSSTDGINGLTFDAGFEPDYAIFAGGGGDPYNMFVDYYEIPSAAPNTDIYVGTTTAGSDGVLTGGNELAPPIRVTIDNSNVIGVTGLPSNISTPSPAVAFGSELDAVYGKVEDGRVYLLVTGNLQTNFSKLALFFDVDPADGQNQLLATNVDADFNGINRMGAGGNGTTGAGGGLKFDTGFTADYFLSFTNGNIAAPENYVNAAVLRADGALTSSGFVLDYSAFDGGARATNNPIDFPATYADVQDFTSTDPLNTDGGPRLAQLNQLVAGTIIASLNNSNVAGVTATSASGAAGVTTGIEFSISLAELGYTSGPVRVAGLILNDSYSFASNQVIGGLPTPVGADFAPNLEEVTNIDFSTIAGDQFVVIPVAPTGPTCGTADFDGDGDSGTDADIEAFFACLAGNCCDSCFGADFDGDGDTGTDADIEAFFRVLAGQPC